MSDQPCPSAAKAKLRQALQATRQALTPTRRNTLDALICGQVLRLISDFDGPSQHIAAYVAHGGEPNLSPVIEALIQSGRSVYLPVLSDQSLAFHRYDPAQAMTPNRFGIEEPIDQPSVPVEALDWVLMPLVGFSADGVRLGMGGGFYDRTLGAMGGRGPIKVGVGYSIQQVDSLPREPFDVLMDGVVSDQGPLWVK